MRNKKRNPIVSLLLSVIAPGLGQIYNGQLKKGITFYFISLLIILTFSIVGLHFYGLIIFIIICIIWFIFINTDSLITAIKTKRIALSDYNRWYYYIIFILLSNIITISVNEFLVWTKTYSIHSGAMRQTLLIGDHIMANNSAYGVRNPFTNKVWVPIGKPQPGDVVVFIFPQDPSKDYIKRVVGLPGDRLQIINKKIMINGKVYKTPEAVYDDPMVIAPPQGPTGSPRDNMGPVVVPANSYFVLGDNRDNSYDSRFWGFVPFDSIRGKALYVYFSWDRKNSMIRWGRIGQTLH